MDDGAIVKQRQEPLGAPLPLVAGVHTGHGLGYAGDLTDDQRWALSQLRAKLNFNSFSHPRFTAALLLRFLRANLFDVAATAAKLEQHLEFRLAHGLDQLSAEYQYGLGPAAAVFPELSIIKRYYPHSFHKTDLHGRPIYIERLGRLDAASLLAEVAPDRILQYFAHESERQTTHRMPACCLASRRLVQSTVSILDMQGLSFRHVTNAAALKLVRSIMRDLENHFPESNGNLFIVNAPGAFWVVWKALQPLISARTLEKIEVFRHGEQGWQTRLLELVAPESLPTFLGGTCTCSGFAGGCMESDAGPWHDACIEKVLGEKPFWEVLAELGDGGPGRSSSQEQEAEVVQQGQQFAAQGPADRNSNRCDSDEDLDLDRFMRRSVEVLAPYLTCGLRVTC